MSRVQVILHMDIQAFNICIYGHVYYRPTEVPFRFRADFNEVAEWKDPLLARAAQRLCEAATPQLKALKKEMEAFRAQHKEWIEDSALFAYVNPCAPQRSENKHFSTNLCRILPRNPSFPFPLDLCTYIYRILCDLPECAGKLWWDWDMPLRQRDPATMKKMREEHEAKINEFIVRTCMYILYIHLPLLLNLT